MTGDIILEKSWIVKDYCVIHYQHLLKAPLISRMFSQVSFFCRDFKLNWSCRSSHYYVIALKSPQRRTQLVAVTTEHDDHWPTGGLNAAVPPQTTKLVPALALCFCSGILSLYWSFVHASVAWVFWIQWRDSVRGRRHGSCNSFWFMPPSK